MSWAHLPTQTAHCAASCAPSSAALSPYRSYRIFNGCRICRTAVTQLLRPSPECLHHEGDDYTVKRKRARTAERRAAKAWTRGAVAGRVFAPDRHQPADADVVFLRFAMGHRRYTKIANAHDNGAVSNKALMGSVGGVTCCIGGNTAALEISGRMLDTACRTHAHCVPQWLSRVSAALFDRGTAADFRIAQHILATSIATTR